MTDTIAVRLPDIGDFEAVEVIEILVAVGDTIEVEQGIITLESDKASMEIPSPSAGIIEELCINLGDKIKNDDLILTLKVATNNNDIKTNTQPNIDTQKSAKTTENIIVAIVVPDIGDFEAVEIIEVLVAVGDTIEVEQGIITLESDKASMEIPSTHAGIISAISVKVGDKVVQGDNILELNAQAEVIDDTKKAITTNTVAQKITNTDNSQSITTNVVNVVPNSDFHASPSIRKLARELGVDLASVKGGGKNGRIVIEDVKSFVKQIITSKGNNTTLPSVRVVDFAKFGDTEQMPLSRINKLSAKHLHACWLNIPHVSQFDEVNIDNLEEFRAKQKAQGIKLTPLVFIMKAVAKALIMHPRFNSSLTNDGEALIIKKYINLGIAVDTPNGLMVPVIMGVDGKSVSELSAELTAISQKARDGKLTATDLQGGCFTISSLGGIGGTNFTPIVNAPEVAILGISRSQIKPIWNGKKFTPSTMLPLALSYDHRVIDGAQGVRFITDLSRLLTDIRELL